MPDQITGDGWACNDCTQALANGESPVDMPADQLAAWTTAIESWPMGSITFGMLREQHSCLDEAGQTASDRGGECDCETDTFSWSPCDVCGGNLGGERHAVTFWEVAR